MNQQRLKISNLNNYKLFNYPDLDEEQQSSILPEDIPFELKDIVYIKSTNAAGVVIGNINYKRECLRTDSDGMQCFCDIELLTERHLQNGINMNKRLFMEITEQLKINRK